MRLVCLCRSLGLAIAIALSAGAAKSAELPTIPLWSKGLPEPAVQTEMPERVELGKDGLSRRFNVSQPRLFVHQPAADRRTKTAVIVVPGGGFGRLADEHEGKDAGEWLAKLGVTAFQLAYRCPTSMHSEPNAGPVQDTQRAIQLVRDQAAQWQIDSDKIGVLGFSAGGQSALIAATNELRFDAGLGSETNPRANFMLLVYPYQIFDAKAKSLRPDIKLDGALPPTFIAQCSDDSGSLPQGSSLLFYELVSRKVPAEIHIYEKGGHGFGMRARPNATGPTDWPLRAADWLKAHGWAQ